MNAKKKNKNRSNKQQNPVPQSDKKEEEKPIEIIETVTEVIPLKEPVVKSEERVPEILSDVITVVPEKDTDNEGPKKPKRNRGKKKNQDDGSGNTDTKDTFKINEPEGAIVSKESNAADDKTQPEVTPTSRKNKGKNKPIEKQEIKELKEEIMTETAPEIKEDDMKQAAKKKKKNKKRNDSERSEKAEELSCTSAFQKLLLQSDEEKVKAKEVTQKSPVVEKESTDEEINKGTATKDITKENITVLISKTTDNKMIQEKESTTNTKNKEQQESKKNNKKDKKQSSYLETDILKALPIETQSIQDAEKTRQTPSEAIKDVPIQKVIEQDTFTKRSENTQKNETEESPKPKAKIAKPVEKKQKSSMFDESNIKTLPEDSNIKIITLEVVDRHKSDAATKNTESSPFEISLERKDSTIPKHEKKGTTFPTVPEEKTDEISSERTMEVKEPEKVEDITSVFTTKTTEMPDKSHQKKGKGKHKNDEDKMKEPKQQTKDVSVAVSVPEVKSESRKDTATDIPQTKDVSVAVSVPEVKSESRKDTATDIPQTKDVSVAVSVPEVKSESRKDATDIPHATKNLATPSLTTAKRGKSPKPTPKTEKIVQEEIKSEKETIIKELATSEDKKVGTQQTKLDKEECKDIKIQKESEIIKTESQIQKDAICLIPKTEVTKVDSIEIPAETSKKRKKSPKPQPKLEVKSDEEIKIEKEIVAIEQVEPQPQTDATKLIPATETPKVEHIEIPTDITSKKCRKSPKPFPKPEKEIQEVKSVTEMKSFIITEPKSEPQKDATKLAPETDSFKEQIEIPIETTKKRKKSPKPTPKPDKTAHEEMRTEKETVFEKSLTSEDNKAGTKQLETDSEIKEVMSTSFQSGSEIGPDVIESPRSTSADIIDTNNNTTIQEINPETLSVPIVIPDTPFIQNSGETPLNTPDVMASSFKVLELNTKGNFKPKMGEKTDLKSKVMEVNKDMEDLRLSIERSLAELTSLEDKDNKFEKNYARKVVQIEPVVSDKPKIDTEKVTTDVVAGDVFEKSKAMPMPSEIVQADVQVETKPSGTPEPPARKDNKGKQKSKKKGKQETSTQQTTATNVASTATTTEKPPQDTSTENKSDQKKDKNEESKEKGKQQSDDTEQKSTEDKQKQKFVVQDDVAADFDPIENFEDAMTSSVDDVNRTFEIIADDAVNLGTETKEIESEENYEEEKDKRKDKADGKQNPLVSQPKNLLGHPAIPVRSNRIDYKKEKNKTPNTILAKVKLKDTTEIEKSKESKQSQTENKPKLIKNRTINESVTCVTSENDEYIYKYSFRKVYLSSNCQICKKDLKVNRVGCNFCNLIFYCSQKHKDEDWPMHQAFCFAVSTVVHLKGQKHLYADCQDVTGHNYRLLRMQAILACEKILRRKLSPHEQEALLYPRICAESTCREWRQAKLKDCDKCGQISYCTENPDHLSKSHARWCKSYALYQKLVVHQLTNGRLEPLLPTRMTSGRIPDNINNLLANLYDQKIDMTDMQYASLTQLATAPLTAAYTYQLYHDKMKSLHTNGISKKMFTLHIVGAELQFEADTLHKWETFFLHLRPDVELLNIVLIGPDLNPSNLPLDLLGKIKLCPNCRVEKRRITFNFQDKKLYHDYKQSDDFIVPDMICTFNPSIHRTSCNSDTWSATINEILKHKSPFLITAYTMNELQRDLAFVKNNSRQDFNVISEAKYNPFGSVRPDRNFITDDEIPLLFKNYCYAVLIGAF